MVGAGIAGITAAYVLAAAGAYVVLLERGPFPGAKNISGGAVYSLPTQEIIPGFWQSAPVERILVDQQYWLLGETSAVKLGFTSTELENPPYNKFSILRSTFDRWYAFKAVEAGAALWAGCQADSLLMDGKRVAGVRVSGSRSGDVKADIVILAQGVNPLLAEKAGLLKKPKAVNCTLYVKEIIALPEETINERFHLQGDQGAVIGLLGDNTANLLGTGSIYTFKKYIGINTGVGVKILADKKANLGELMAQLKRHPVVRPLIKGGTTVEYLAHMIPEGGFEALPAVVFDGMMVVGDAAGLVNGTHGLNLAMYSGKYAAETAVEALKKGNCSRTALKAYRQKLENSFVLKDLRDNKKIPGWFTKNPTLMDDYVGLMNHVAFQMAVVYPVPRREKRRLIRREVLAARPLRKLLIDAFHAARVTR